MHQGGIYMSVNRDWVTSKRHHPIKRVQKGNEPGKVSEETFTETDVISVLHISQRLKHPVHEYSRALDATGYIQ